MNIYINKRIKKMNLNRAFKILKKYNIKYNDYFDLIGIETYNHFVKEAIERIKTFITIGK